MKIRMGAVAVAGFAALALAACESKADKVAEKQADAVEATSEARADALEKQGANQAADAVEQAGDAKADKIEQDAGKKD